MDQASLTLTPVDLIAGLPGRAVDGVQLGSGFPALLLRRPPIPQYLAIGGLASLCPAAALIAFQVVDRDVVHDYSGGKRSGNRTQKPST